MIKTVDLSMPNYVNKDLARQHHPPLIKPQRPPDTYNAPIYGQKRQFVIPTITNEKLTPAQLKHCQEFCVFFNYYARSIDNTMQTSISAIASSLSTSPWTDIKFWINQYLNFIHLLTPMPKFDTMQVKCIYGFTLMPHISMNRKLSLATVVYYNFCTNPNYLSNPMILH